MYRHFTRSALALSLLATTLHAAASTPPVSEPAKVPTSKPDILAAMEKMADAQLAQPAYKNGAPFDWVAGAFYIGLARLTHVSESPRFLDAEKNIADKNNWEFKPSGSARNIAMADNETIGQMYLDLSQHAKDPLGKLDRIRTQWDEVISGFDNPANIANWNGNLARDGKPMPWWWCDAFFMAPPGLARLSAITNDRKYLDAADRQWWITTEKLYDPAEHLFYRDSVYIAQKSPNGKKVFWSRGNGWVIAGTANLLTYMPAEYPSRPKYEQLFKQMSDKLASLQQPGGLWRMSLIDPESNPNPETSGTGFFCYAFAWGINNHLLDRAKFEPLVNQAWAGMNQHILPSGLIGAVQPVGAQPVNANYTNTSQPYAVGAYLLAGCEIIKLHGDK